MTCAIILAGGLGTRLRAVVPDRPKPMALINGRPFLVHLMDYWLGQGVDRFVLSVGYRHDMIQDFFGSSYRGAPLAYAMEEAPLGTGGGLLLALPQAGDETCLLLNGDTFFAVPLPALLACHAERGADWTLSLFRAAEADRYMGVQRAADGRIEDLAAGRGEVGGYANGGVYALEPAAVRGCGFAPGIKLSLEDDLLPRLQRQNARLFGLACPGMFIDIGVPADYQRAHEWLQ
ncbi:MAG TPA: NTP transferase domain-containing protein [Acidocella sp.]|nr:NTP transferase domain-containing protein [Acidocella sp.]